MTGWRVPMGLYLIGMFRTTLYLTIIIKIQEITLFSDDFIDSYLGVKDGEVTRLLMTTHPLEFEMYYSV